MRYVGGIPDMMSGDEKHLSCVLIEKFSFLKEVAAFMGFMSLESYFWNVHLGAILNHVSWKLGGYDFSYGHYLEYATVLIVGIALAYLCYLDR